MTIRKHKKRNHERTPPRIKRRMRTAVAVFGLALGAVSPLHAQTMRKVSIESRDSASAIDARWRESLEAFAAIDRAKAPAPGGIVFVGSSSIRLWDDLEREFGADGIVKRGFGGSRLSDCARYVAQLVLPYKPRLVVVYAGDNDLAEGRDAARTVLASFTEFVDQVRAALPDDADRLPVDQAEPVARGADAGGDPGQRADRDTGRRAIRCSTTSTSTRACSTTAVGRAPTSSWPTRCTSTPPATRSGRRRSPQHLR